MPPGQGNGDEERALLQCLDIVGDAMVECYQLPDGQLDLLIWEMNADPTLERMDRNSGIGMVLFHLCVRLHEHQHDAEIRVLSERLRTAPGFALP